MAYFQDIKRGIQTSLKGLSLTWRHIRNATKRRSAVGVASDNYFDQQTGLVTLQYPHEQLPIPDTGRYRLNNEIDDCIVCDKCAKICPVDCITIDAIKATEEVGRASDGSPIRLYAATFDIDMAKCCYCGLCTVVCPTECLTMDKKFDYSEFDLAKLTYHYADLTPAEADEKRTLYEQFVQEKEAQKAAQVAAKATATPSETTTSVKRPAFRPTAKSAEPVVAEEKIQERNVEQPQPDATPTEMEQIAQGGLETTKKPVFRPTRKPAPPAPIEPGALVAPSEEVNEDAPKSAPKPAFRPSMKPTPTAIDKPVAKDLSETTASPAPQPAGFRPSMKPAEPAPEPTADLPPDKPATAKPTFRPTMKPKAPTKSPADGAAPVDDTSTPDQPVSETVTPKPAGFRPTMKPRPTEEPAPEVSEASAEPTSDKTPKQKPVFRPTMKPKSKPDNDKSTPS